MNLNLSWGISYNLIALHQHTIKTNSRCITIDSITIWTIWYSQDIIYSQSTFQLCEAFITIIWPLKHDHLLSQPSQWWGHGWKSFHEPSIITWYNQETLNICCRGRSAPLFHCFYLLRFYSNSFTRHNVPKERNWW